MVNRSYALHELGRTTEVRENLLGVVARFPGNATIRYNLACYACQRGDLKATRAWRTQAFALNFSAAFKQGALADPDLAPLWTEEQLNR